MSLEGMDVERAQSIARQLDNSAQALTSINGALGILTTELIFHWRGPASVTFEQQWTARHQPVLHAASSALADMHAHLAANIAEQTRASAADGPGWLAGADRAWEVVKALHDVHLGVDGAKGLIHRIAGNKLITGRYTKTWTRWLRQNHDAPFWKYKSSPVLHSLHDNQWIQKASRTLDNPRFIRFFDVTDKIGGKLVTPIAVIGVGIDVGHIVKAAENRQYLHAAGYTLNAVGTGLMAIPYPPVMAIGLGITVAQEIPWHKVWAASEDYLPVAMSMFAAGSPARLSRKLQEIF